MAGDTTTPLCSWAQFTAGAFADLARAVTDPTDPTDLLMESTRLCEGAAGGRRLAPFVGLTETHRLAGLDPDEYSDAANLPLDLQGTVGRSYAAALSASTLVRHTWLDQFAPHYPNLWAYSNITVHITRSYGGSQDLAPGQYTGPAPDSGHVWFRLGLFIPIGSYAEITYSGGYQTTPADLRRAAKNMLASLILRELIPEPQGRDPELLLHQAESICARYGRD